MSNSAQLSARLLIMETLNRYAWGYDSRDLALLGDSFTVDGSFTVTLPGSAGWGPHHGRQAIVDWLAGIMQTQADQRRHSVSNIIFRALDERTALVDSFLTLTAVEHGKVRLVCTGTCRDEMLYDAGTWRIRHRTLHLDCPF